MSPDVKGSEPFTRQDNPVQVIIHDLTLAQMATFETTPFELVPAPGTGEFTKLLSIRSIYTEGSEAAEFGEDTFFNPIYADDNPLEYGAPSEAVFDDTKIVDWGGYESLLPTTIVGQPVLLKATEGTLTAGNGTVRLIVRFVQHSIA